MASATTLISLPQERIQQEEELFLPTLLTRLFAADHGFGFLTNLLCFALKKRIHRDVREDLLYDRTIAMFINVCVSLGQALCWVLLMAFVMKLPPGACLDV